MKVRVSMDQAVSDFLAYHARSHTPGTVRQSRIAMEKFRAIAKCTYVDEVLRYHLHQYEASHTRQQVSAVRVFLRWCNEHYGMMLPLPPIHRIAGRPRIADAPQRGATARDWVRLAESAAQRMEMPHQRLIYLCGYLYGMPIAKVVKITLQELCELPMRVDFYDLLDSMRRLMPATGPAFQPWLGRSVVHARRVWREWSGGVPFTTINCAGDVARVGAGIRPIGGHRTRNSVLDLLQPVSPPLMDRMPKFWAA